MMMEYYIVGQMKLSKFCYHLEDMGHLCCARVLELTRERLFWPKVATDIEHYARFHLKDRRPVITMRAPVQRFITSEPFELISLDFLHLERGPGGCE